MNFTIGLAPQQQPGTITRLNILVASSAETQWMFLASKTSAPVDVIMNVPKAMHMEPIQTDYVSLFDHLDMLFGFSYIDDAQEQHQWVGDMLDIVQPEHPTVTITQGETEDSFAWRITRVPVAFKLSCPMGKTWLPKVTGMHATLFTIGCVEMLPMQNNGDIQMFGAMVPTIAQWCPLEASEDLSIRIETARLPAGFPADAHSRYVIRTEKYQTAPDIRFIRNLDWFGTTECSRTITTSEGRAVDDVLLVQPWFNCHTCGIVNSNGVCAVCAYNCHKGHRVTFRGVDPFYCDCKDAEGRCSK